MSADDSETNAKKFVENLAENTDRIFEKMAGYRENFYNKHSDNEGVDYRQLYHDILSDGYHLLADIKDVSLMSYDTLMSRLEDRYLEIKMILEKNKSSAKTVPWEEIKKNHYDRVLGFMENEGLVDTFEYANKKMYKITAKGISEYDRFLELFKKTLDKINASRSGSKG